MLLSCNSVNSICSGPLALRPFRVSRVTVAGRAGASTKTATMKPQKHKKPEYFTWASMKQRCLNPKTSGFKNYGGRGVSVCERWIQSFDAFLSDMGEKPSPKHSIDRFPDTNGNYEPSNCRWATMEEQQNNKTTNLILSLNGVEITVAQWAKKLGFKRSLIHGRMERGWSVEKALTTPITPNGRMITHNGKTMSINAWAKHLGINATTIKWRLYNGRTIKQSLSDAAKGKGV